MFELAMKTNVQLLRQLEDRRDERCTSEGGALRVPAPTSETLRAQSDDSIAGRPSPDKSA